MIGQYVEIGYLKHFCTAPYIYLCFLSQLIFIFPLLLGMVMCANEFKTKEKQKVPEMKN